MFVERSENGLVVHTPAKINLALEVLGRQTDGYHAVETLLVPVRLFDTLVYSATTDPLQFSLRVASQVENTGLDGPPRDNLAVRAIQRLAAISGHEPSGRICLYKRIPAQAGLGGGSSDAAAALVAANVAWGLGYSRERLSRIAAQIGTDVPFFVVGGAAFGTGRGERLVRAPIPAGMPIVLVQPPVGLSTPKVFESLGLAVGEGLGGGTGRCRKLMNCLRRGLPIQRARPLIRNCLQRSAEKLSCWIARASDVMDRLPVLAHQMTGSGSAYFGICRTWREARLVASRLRMQPWQFVAATQTCR